MSELAGVCLIVKNEVDDIAEWIDHYCGIGFDHAIIYDDGSTDGTSELICNLMQAYPITHYLVSSLPEVDSGDLRQHRAYSHACRTFAGSLEWLFFVDSDEFLVPSTDGHTLRELLHSHNTEDAFALNWRVFGSAGLDHSDGRLVMEAYDRRANLYFNPNRHVKMFCRPENVLDVVNPHYLETRKSCVDLNGQPMQWSERGITTPSGIVAGAWGLHHYFVRSSKHWSRRVARSQIGEAPRNEAMRKEFDRNEVLDASAFACARRTQARLSAIRIAKAVVPTSPNIIWLNHDLPGHGLPEQQPDMMCFLDEIKDGVVKGWAAETKPVMKSTTLDVFVDTDFCCRVHGNELRGDVERSIGFGLVGFTFELPPWSNDGRTHNLELRHSDGRIILMTEGSIVRSVREFVWLRDPI